MDVFGRGISIIVSIILIFLLPMQYIYDAHYHQEHTQVTEKTIAFTEAIRIEGQLTSVMYENFLIDIGKHGSLFDVELEIAKAHIGSADMEDRIQSMFYSKNTDRNRTSIKTLEIGKEPSGLSYYNGCQTVTLTYTGLVGNAKTNGRSTATTTVITTPKKVAVSLSVTPSSSWVYNGSEPTYVVRVNYDDGSSVNITNYTKTGFTKGSGNKQVMFTYTEDGKKVSATVSIVVKKNIKTCNYGHTYELDDNDVDQGCNICANKVSKISVTPSSLVLSRGDDIKNAVRVIATYFNESTKYVTGWTSDFNSNQLGSQYVTISYQGATSMIEVTVVDELICSICGNAYDPLPDGSDGGCPTCSSTIVSLRVTPSNQTILKDTPLPLTVIAVYKDGSSKEVMDYTSNFNSSVIGEQKVTVYYGGITAVIQVTVTDDMTTCNACGNTYSWKLNPLGCPFCSTTIVDMEAYVSGGGNHIVYGSELSLDIILTYKDGHRELALEGYEYSGYEPYQLGEQRIRVVYGSFIDIIDIIVINNMQKVTCDVGHVYYLNEDGSDPGCNACFSNSDLRKQGSKYEVVLMTEEILEQLENTKKIYFDKGDYITVRVIPREKENKKSFYHLDGDFKSIIYGGRISNES